LIIGYSDLLLASHRPADPAFQDIMQIKQNANRAARLEVELDPLAEQALQEQGQVGERFAEMDHLRPKGQQRAAGDHRLLGPAAGEPPPGRSGLPGHHADQACCCSWCWAVVSSA
jgi:hypothetical protein